MWLATNKNQKYCRIFCHHPKSHPQNNPYPKRETHNPLPHCAYLRPCACLLRTSRERDNRGKGKREIMAMAMAFRRLSSSVDKPIKRGGSLYYMVSSLFYAYVVLPLFMQGNLVFYLCLMADTCKLCPCSHLCPVKQCTRRKRTVSR